jgi:hypothetical protein
VVSANSSRLFLARVGAANDFFKHYESSKDGRRFLVDVAVEENAHPVTLILNWKGRH